MTFKDAMKQCGKVGTAHATGDALRAMYAAMISFHQCGVLVTPTNQRNTVQAEKFYSWLADKGDDNGIHHAAKELMRDRMKAWDVLMDNEVSL